MNTILLAGNYADKLGMVSIVEWTKCYLDKEDMIGCMDRQIQEFIGI